MRRSMSRTPPVARYRRSATPARLSNAVNSAGRSPLPDCLELHRLPSRAVSPLGTRLIGNSVPASASLVLPSVSQITAADPPTNSVTQSDSRWVEDVEICALCQTELHAAVPVWQWPCRCRVRLHLSCMVQLRMRADALPVCVAVIHGLVLLLTLNWWQCVNKNTSQFRTLGRICQTILSGTFVTVCRVDRTISWHCVARACLHGMPRCMRGKWSGCPTV